MQNNDDPTLSPNEQSEIGVSGSTPDPESDDNMLDNEKDVGLYPDATEDDAPELNIADEVEKAVLVAGCLRMAALVPVVVATVAENFLPQARAVEACGLRNIPQQGQASR